MSVQPRTIAVPQSVLDDLQERLARTRWIDAAQDDGWTYGIGQYRPANDTPTEPETWERFDLSQALTA